MPNFDYPHQSDADNRIATADPPSLRLIAWPELRKLLGGRSWSSVRRDELSGRFPGRLKVGRRQVRWYAHEINEHLRRLPRGSANDNHRPNTDSDHHSEALDDA